MADTLNISLTEGQKGWLLSRQEMGGFSSASDVVRDLIRRKQEQDQIDLRSQFQAMDAADGADEIEPPQVLNLVREVKRERRG